MRVPSYISWKEGHEKELLLEYQLLKERGQIIAEDMALFCHSNGVKFLLTDIVSNPDEDKRLGRVSKSHSECRAFDFRVWGWSKEFLAKFELYFENKYKHWAALSKESLQPNLIVYHDNGNGIHGHCQIHPY